MKNRLQAVLAAILLGVSLVSAAQVEDIGAARLAERFRHLAGTEENALALVLALRSGSTVRLAAESAGGMPEMVSLELPTPPMTWADVRVTLLNVQDQLARGGIVKPSLEQLHAALLGGEVTAVDGSTLMLRGVLQLRAEGLSWPDIARASDALPATRRVSGSR